MPSDVSLQPPKSTQLSLDKAARERIVQVATDAFLQCGYERTTLDGVAKAARVSKTTVYEHFRDKAALFEAALDWALVPVVENQPQFSSDARPPQAVLAHISRWIYGNFMRPDNIGLYRVNIEVAAHFPDLAGALNGYRQFRGSVGVADYFSRLAKSGAVAIIDSAEAARWIGVLSVGGTYHLMGGAPLTTDGRDARARATAALFLGGASAVADAIDQPSPERDTEREARPRMRLAGDRHGHLLAVAAKEFIAFGFRGANIDRVVAETGISKMTIRRHHGNKAGLYRAAMEERAKIYALRISMDGRSPPRDVLTQIGFAVIEQAFDTDRVRFQRAMIADAARDPATARIVYHALSSEAVAALTAYFRSIGLNQPVTVARQFLILAASGNLALIGEHAPVSADREQYVKSIVDLMCGR